MWLGIAVSRLIISPNIKASSLHKIYAGSLISAAALTAGLLSSSFLGIAAASLVVGLSSGFTIPLILAIGCEWYRDKTAFGTMMPFTGLFIAYAVFPPFSGLIADMTGIPWGVSVAALSAILTALFAGALDTGLKKEIR